MANLASAGGPEPEPEPDPDLIDATKEALKKVDKEAVGSLDEVTNLDQARTAAGGTALTTDLAQWRHSLLNGNAIVADLFVDAYFENPAAKINGYGIVDSYEVAPSAAHKRPAAIVGILVDPKDTDPDRPSTCYLVSTTLAPGDPRTVWVTQSVAARRFVRGFSV
jgi:hypothetical protein